MYDSKPSCSLNSSTLRMQVAAIMKTPARSFDLFHVDVQRQVGASDCGLFVIAFATTLCQGGDPHITSYLQGDMRSHFVKCLEAEIISEFPAPQRPRRLGRQRVIKRQNVDVFCTCRLPWNKHNSENGPLVQCQMCKEWFHQVCMEIDQDIVDQPALRYNCKLCLFLLE